MDDNIIVCTSPQRTLILAEAARALDLDYVKFDVFFAEGHLAYGGEMTGTPPAIFKMQPVWATLGDYDNLLGMRMLLTTGSQEPRALDSHLLAVDSTSEKSELDQMEAALATEVVHFDYGDKPTGAQSQSSGQVSSLRRSSPIPRTATKTIRTARARAMLHAVAIGCGLENGLGEKRLHIFRVMCENVLGGLGATAKERQDFVGWAHDTQAQNYSSLKHRALNSIAPFLLSGRQSKGDCCMR